MPTGTRRRATGQRQRTAPTLPHPQPFSPELLSIIRYELRGPLAAIKGYAATLWRHE